jgi:hypothetical protein
MLPQNLLHSLKLVEPSLNDGFLFGSRSYSTRDLEVRLFNLLSTFNQLKSRTLLLLLVAAVRLFRQVLLRFASLSASTARRYWLPKTIDWALPTFGTLSLIQ